MKLKKREQDVLDLMCLGKTNKDIATILGVSATTIDAL